VIEGKPCATATEKLNGEKKENAKEIIPMPFLSFFLWFPFGFISFSFRA
jgi:hypothetical protein